MWEEQRGVLEVSPKLSKLGKDKDSEIAERKFSQAFTRRWVIGDHVKMKILFPMKYLKTLPIACKAVSCF